MVTESSSERPSRDRPPQAENLNIRLPTVITVTGAIIGIIAGSLVAAGVASYRLSEAEHQIDVLKRERAEDRKELQAVRDTARELQLGQARHAELIDSSNKASEKTRDAQVEQGELLRMMCINVNFKAYAGLNCWGKK